MKLSKVNFYRFSFVIIFCILNILTVNSQEEKGKRLLGYYDQSEYIGQVLLVTDTAEDGAIKVTMESHYTINPTVELKVDEGSSFVIKNDSIISIACFAEINDRSRFKIDQKWSKASNKYTRTVNSRTKDLEIPMLHFSYLSLFFSSPTESVKEVYSEVFDKYFDVQRNSATKYVVTDHLDRTHVFYYNDEGDFKSAEITNATGVYTIKELKK